MTEVSRPWSGTSTGDAGPYSDDQWATTWMNMIGFGADSANRGVIRGVDDDLRVTAQSPASNAVDVNLGAAVVQGKWYLSDAVESFTISANGSGNPRIDTIALRADYTAQTVRLVLKTGTPAATPAAPTLTQTATTTWEIPIADIEVANGFATITQDNIINRQDWANVPNQISIELTSADADDLVPGTPAKLDTNGDVVYADNAGTLSNYFDDYLNVAYAGVVAERISNGDTGRIIVQGLAYVLLEDTVNPAELIGPGLNNAFTSRDSSAFSTPVVIWGIALEAGVSGDRILAYLDVPNASPLYSCVLEDTAATIVNGAFTATSFGGGTEVFDPLAMHSTSTNPTRITVPITGLYKISASIQLPSATYSANPFIQVRVDGTTALWGQNNPTGTYSPFISISGEYPLTAGQYIEVMPSQTSGANRTANVKLSVTRMESQ